MFDRINIGYDQIDGCDIHNYIDNYDYSLQRNPQKQTSKKKSCINDYPNLDIPKIQNSEINIEEDLLRKMNILSAIEKKDKQGGVSAGKYKLNPNPTYQILNCQKQLEYNKKLLKKVEKKYNDLYYKTNLLLNIIFIVIIVFLADYLSKKMIKSDKLILVPTSPSAPSAPPASSSTSE
jgi:hypothetical protein